MNIEDYKPDPNHAGWRVVCICGKPAGVNSQGRKRTYCSNACRMKAVRVSWNKNNPRNKT